MDEILEKAGDINEKMCGISRHIGCLEKKREKIVADLGVCDEEIKRVNLNIRQILSSGAQIEESHILPRTLFWERKVLTEKKQEIKYLLKKYDYHLTVAKRKLEKYQEKISNSPEIYFYSR